MSDQDVVTTETGQNDIETVEETLTGTAGAEETAEETTEVDGEEKKGEVPDQYEVKLDEGMELDKALLELFTPVFKDMEMTNEEVQKLAEKFVPWITQKEDEIRSSMIEKHKETVKAWGEEAVRQLGTDSARQLGYAAKARDKFGSKEFVEMVNETGIGNHPEMVKFLVKVGKTISEDKFVDGSGTQKADLLKILYPTMK